jgi:hypothetical protein
MYVRCWNSSAAEVTVIDHSSSSLAFLLASYLPAAVS